MLLLLLTVSAVWAQSKPTYRRYLNVRFGYGISYPEGLLIPQGEADNADGQRFLAREGDVELLVWGVHNVRDETIESHFREESRSRTREHPDRQVTYKHRTGNLFVVSGYTEGKVFYQKTILGDNAFLTFYISYPSAKKPLWDAIVAEMAQSFRYLGTTAR